MHSCPLNSGVGRHPTSKVQMSKPNRNYVLLVLAPALFGPISIALARQEQANFFLGLSSDFWAGTMIGATIAAALLGIGLLVRSRQF